MTVELVATRERGEGVLRIGGHLFRALVPEGIPKGTRLPVEVISAGPPLLLRLAGQRGADQKRLLTPPPRGLATAARELLDHAPQPDRHSPGGQLLLAARHILILPRNPDALAPALARWVLGSGILRQAPVARDGTPADLKSILLKFLSLAPAGRLREAAEVLLGHLETYQTRTTLENSLVVPLLLPWGEEWGHGELRIDTGRKGAEKDGSAVGSLRIRLEMPHLGPVEALVRWGEAGIFVRLSLEPRALAPVRSRVSELSESLGRNAGVRLAELRVEPLTPAVRPGQPCFVEVLA